MNRTALSLATCQQLGERFATLGWTEAAVGDWLVSEGYAVRGVSAGRIARAYLAQVARG